MSNRKKASNDIRDKSLETIRKDLLTAELRRNAAWWASSSFLERVSLITCAQVVISPATSREEIRKIACESWEDISSSARFKLIKTIQKIARHAKKHGLIYV